MKVSYASLCLTLLTIVGLACKPAVAQELVPVSVEVTNISPDNGVALTPVWAGFHTGNFDSYNDGLKALAGLERLAEDGNTSLISRQFLDFDQDSGGYTYIDTSGKSPASRLVRTGDLADQFRQDATLGAAPLLPGDSAAEVFMLRNDGSNDFFSYASMVLPSNDFFVANGSPTAHDISDILINGGSISFVIGTPNGGVNDAGTEKENFQFSAGNGLFPGRNLLRGQKRANQGPKSRSPIANVIGNPFADFRLKASKKKVIDVSGLDFNQYDDGIAVVTITAFIDFRGE